jgi:tetratricopeptide (TPR) repeat protein
MNNRLLRAAVGLLAGCIIPAALAEEPVRDKPPCQRLQGADAKKAEELQKRRDALLLAGKLDEALPSAEELAQLRQERQGKEHWQAVDARFTAEGIRRALRSTPEDRQGYVKRFQLVGRAVALQQRGRFREALPVVEQILAICRKVLGEEHPDTAIGYNSVGYALEAQGKYAAAQEGYLKALAIRRKVLGEEHPDTAQSYNSIASNLSAQGKYAAAQEGFRKALAIQRKVLGEEDPDTALSYNNLATCLAAQGQAAEAAQAYRKALAIQRKVLGEEHLRTALTCANLALNLNAQGKYAEAAEFCRKSLAIRRKVLGEEHPDTAHSYSSIADNLEAQGKYEEAEQGYRKSLAIRRKVLGEEHPDTATSYNNVAANLNHQGKYAEAAEFGRKALAIRRKVLGEEHPDTAQSYNNVAFTLNAQGKYVEAARGYNKALAIRRKVFGEEHPATAQSYNNVAANLDAQGKYAEAAQGLRKALDIQRKVLGDEHPITASGYDNIAAILDAQGQYAEAAEFCRKALAIHRKVLGVEHPRTATCYRNLAYSLHAQGKYAEAEEALRKALDIQRKVLGDEHPKTATTYDSLAVNLAAQGKHAEAAEFCRKALTIHRKVFGEEHPDTAQNYYNLAYNLDAQGKFAEAADGYRKALAIRRKVLGEEHPYTVASYSHVAASLNAQGQYAAAEELWQRAARSFATARFHLTSSGLERATLTSELSPLPHLACVLARNGKSEQAWQRYEESLSRGTWDDLSARLRRPPAERARQAELVARLRHVDQRIEKTLASKEATTPQEKALEELLGQRRAAQEDLDAFARHLEEVYGPAAGQVFDLSRSQAALVEGMALVGWLDIPPAGPKAADPNGEHWAFLLRSTGPPLCVRLKGSGPGGEWTNNDTDLPAQLRASLLERRGDWQRLARQVSEQRLKPLREKLAAQGKVPAVRQLVVLPSPALAGVPLEVLAEDLTISYALSGTLHAHLKAQPAAKGSGLLALGDPVFETAPARTNDKPLPPGGVLLTLVQPGSNAAEAMLRPDDVLLRYGDREVATVKDLQEAIAAADGKADVPVQVWRDGKVHSRRVHPGKLGIVLASEPAPRALAERYRLDRRLGSRSGDDGWAPLPGTRVEVESLQRLFPTEPRPLLLLDSEASEQKLDALAGAGELGKYRYVHLATHGEVDNSRALRSAIILSRDDLPDPQQQLLAGKPIYDGRLTAEEMLRSWNLDADLVTLSACQTALGKYEKGEGFVGFAQALILCGSRSVCLSLWKVDDVATALLMRRFYANLLGKREGLKSPLGKAEALAEAKCWLRTLSREQALKHAAAVYQGIERGKGRTKPPLLPALPEVKEDCPYAHPYYWAAFVLTGAAD